MGLNKNCSKKNSYEKRPMEKFKSKNTSNFDIHRTSSKDKYHHNGVVDEAKRSHTNPMDVMKHMFEASKLGFKIPKKPEPVSNEKKIVKSLKPDESRTKKLSIDSFTPEIKDLDSQISPPSSPCSSLSESESSSSDEDESNLTSTEMYKDIASL